MATSINKKCSKGWLRTTYLLCTPNWPFYWPARVCLFVCLWSWECYEASVIGLSDILLPTLVWMLRARVRRSQRWLSGLPHSLDGLICVPYYWNPSIPTPWNEDTSILSILNGDFTNTAPQWGCPCKLGHLFGLAIELKMAKLSTHQGPLWLLTRLNLPNTRLQFSTPTHKRKGSC